MYYLNNQGQYALIFVVAFGMTSELTSFTETCTQAIMQNVFLEGVTSDLAARPTCFIFVRCLIQLDNHLTLCMLCNFS